MPGLNYYTSRNLDEPASFPVAKWGSCITGETLNDDCLAVNGLFLPRRMMPSRPESTEEEGAKAPQPVLVVMTTLQAVRAVERAVRDILALRCWRRCWPPTRERFIHDLNEAFGMNLRQDYLDLHSLLLHSYDKVLRNTEHAFISKTRTQQALRGRDRAQVRETLTTDADDPRAPAAAAAAPPSTASRDRSGDRRSIERCTASAELVRSDEAPDPTMPLRVPMPVDCNPWQRTSGDPRPSASPPRGGQARACGRPGLMQEDELRPLSQERLIQEMLALEELHFTEAEYYTASIATRDATIEKQEAYYQATIARMQAVIDNQGAEIKMLHAKMNHNDAVIDGFKGET